MSLENCLPRYTLAAMAGCAFLSTTALAAFDSNDDRCPTPAHVSSSVASFSTPSGTYQIDSFFDIFTELQRVPPPVFGTPPQVDSFFDVFTELSMSHDMNPLPPMQVPMQCDIQTTCVVDDSGTRFFDTEMLSMSLSGGGLPQGVMIRESPTLPSRGQTSVTDIGGGLYHIDSFFDVFTELSLDGGQTWIPSSGSFRLTGVPEPTTLGVLAGATMLLIRRRHN